MTGGPSTAILAKRSLSMELAMPRKIVLRSHQSPGDILMLTAAVRDLYNAHGDEVRIVPQTAAPQLWENNPYISKFTPGPDVEDIQAEYPLIHQSNTHPYHFIHGYRKFLEEKLGLDIPAGPFRGDIHISEKEKSWINQVEETRGWTKPFWIIIAGGKWDFTAKWWNPEYAQSVVDHFKGRIQFVQCGERGHWHPRLKNVIDFVGKTDLRQFVRLMYHAQGVVCPVTFAMHLAAAVPQKVDTPKNRPCVVVAGGREPAQWEAYPHHRFLSRNGALPCCDYGGCWRSRCQKVGDKDEKDEKNLCEFPVQLNPDLRIPWCMNDITAHEVIGAIETYFRGGVLEYLQ